MKITLDEFEQLFEKFIEQRPDRFVELLKRPNVQDALMKELEYSTGRRDLLKLGLVGLLATLGGLGVASMRGDAAIFHRQPDGSYVRGWSVDDLPTIPRSKLEYPTENVSFAYLASIDKLQEAISIYDLISVGSVTVDNFSDKAVKGIALVNGGSRLNTLTVRYNDVNNYYAQTFYIDATTEDFKIIKNVSGTITNIANEAVDLSLAAYQVALSVSGSTLKAFRSSANALDINLTTAQLSVTDTSFVSGKFGIFEFIGADYVSGVSPLSARLTAPLTKLKPAVIILECAEFNLVRKLVNVCNINTLDFIKKESKRYEILKSKGFTDKEMEDLLGYIPQRHVDLAAVTWGAFDHKPEHNTMLITITAGNPYTGEKAIQEQVEHAKKKNLIVLKPPKDYNEAVQQYRTLRKDFPEWIAGKDNYAYQTLGHECFEHFAVADFYYGAIFDAVYGDNPFKNVPEWELQNTLAMWEVRLSRGEILKSTEKEQHMFKLRQCCKEYNVPEWRVAVRELIEFGTLKVALEGAA